MRTCETGMKTKREDTGEDAWRATCAIRLCDYSCRIFEHARVRSCDIQYLERAKLFLCEKRSNTAAPVLSSRILRPSRNGMLCIMVTPQTALRARKANSRIPRGLDAVQDTRQVYVLVPIIAPVLNRYVILTANKIPLPDHAPQNGSYKNVKKGNRRSSQVRSIEGKVKNGKGSRTEREEDDYYGSSMSEALMGVWQVTSPLQAGREGDFTIEESVECRDLTGKPHKIAPTGGISGFQLPGRTEKHLAVHYAVHSIV
ncbi:hypothetical protein G5I_14052 [Acromyrmex echinatior]|uniref:Uncharacterized protein n=1 Tax=Acromyrmex echinatior TaxID=103372 RepID=F4X6T3_ACREC|nr:hypothetical protein G5I_14052 [Acromyrmex echinatior]